MNAGWGGILGAEGRGKWCRPLFGRGQAEDAHGRRPAAVHHHQSQRKSDDHLYCAACGHGITRARNGMAVAGSHLHTFFNPAGRVFEIACFTEAPGCRINGEATAEFSWFAGYRWSYALCGNCASHLGWYFSGEEASFFGLIQAKLQPFRQ